MKRKIFSAVLAFVMLLTLAPVALAQEEGPKVTDLTIIIGEHEFGATDGMITIPGNTTITSLDFQITFSEPVTFVQSPYAETPDSLPEGAVYVKNIDSEGNVYINFNAEANRINFNDSICSIVFTKTDSENVWSGHADALVVTEGTEVTVSALLTSLSAYNPAQLMAGTFKSAATDAENETDYIMFNLDNTNAYIRQSGTGAEITTVKFICNSETYTWKLPIGSNLQLPIPPVFQGLTFDGWYTDEGFTEEATNTTIVTADMVIYAKYTGESSDFETDLLDPETTVAYINSLEDFNIFASKANLAGDNKLVVLNKSIDCNNASYPSIEYAGDFDGKNNAISNATFTPSANNTANCGMFATLGKGQIIANLKLNNITIAGNILSTTNAGTLAGSISAQNGDAPTGDKPLIQNVQISGGSVTGWNAGGLVGYTFVSTIQYCSVEGTRVTGLANAGGIAAQSYTVISNCYTKGYHDTNLLSAGYTGGVVATALEASNTIYVWTDYSNVAARFQPDSSHSHDLSNFTDYGANGAELLSNNGFSPEIWDIDNEETGFIESEITYQFNHQTN